jgi:hypothetical protein
MARNMDEKQPLLKNENTSQIDIESGLTGGNDSSDASEMIWSVADKDSPLPHMTSSSTYQMDARDKCSFGVVVCVSDDSIGPLLLSTRRKLCEKANNNKQISIIYVSSDVWEIKNSNFHLSGSGLQPQQTTTSSIGPDELPPPYTSNEDRGLPMVTCRVCSAMIDISWKREQHVVKCNQCNEATVS